MHSPTLSFFVCTIIFVLQIGLLVLYKYWPMPTCIFFSLIIISLCWLHLPTSLKKTLYSLFTRTEHRILIFGYTSLGNSYSFTEDFSESILHLNPQPLAKDTTVQPPTPTNQLHPGRHYLCPNMSLRLSRHSTYLTTALVKYPEALPTNRHFRLSITLTVGFRSHQYTFGTLHPDPSGIPQLFVETSLFLKSLGNLYLDKADMYGSRLAG